VSSPGRWSIALLLLWVGHVPPALTAESRAISCDLPRCFAVAFANHPLLKAGEARQAAARSQLDVRLAERQPSLTLEGESGYLEGRAITPFSKIAGVTEEGVKQRRVSGGYYQGTLGLDVPLVKEATLYGRPSASVRQAQLKISEEDWQGRVIRLQIATTVAEAYVQVLKSRQGVQMQSAIVTALEAGYQLTQSRFEQQLVSRSELLSAEVRLATARRDLAVARLNLQKSQQALVTAMGLDRASLVDIQELPLPAAPLPTLDALLAQTRQTHPELKAQQFRVQGSREEVSRIESARYPTLSLTARYGFVDDFAGSPDDQWSAALKVTVPVFDFGLIRKKAEVARAKVVEEEQQLQDVQLGIEQEIRTLYLQLQTLEEQAHLIKTQIEQATEEVERSRAMAQQQLLPPAAVFDAEAALRRFQLALAEAEYDRQLARVQLGLVSGTWDLEAPPR
jgi:outer membrane protein